MPDFEIFVKKLYFQATTAVVIEIISPLRLYQDIFCLS